MEVRCRMAPSPTGKLHIGTAHTALFNYLFAKHHGGKFILRIDDSDPIRSKKEFEADIIDSLQWLGITWDEGPDIGGPYAPYRQSERLNTYQKYIDQLLNTTHAYRCFCTKEELDEKRKFCEKNGQMYKYDQKCLHLSTYEVDTLLKDGKSYVVRLKNPNKVVTFTDMVRGEISVDTTSAGDFIIFRSDGTPLLNFAVTVDDIEFKISHAVRGEDFLNATPNQILIYEALGINPPQFANLSFIYAPDHTKLSKRHGATGVSEFRELGYLPEAMVNFLAFLGWNPGDDREIFSVSDLIREFDFDKVDRNAPTFNQAKLDWFNGHYIRQKSDTELTTLVKPYMKNKNVEDTKITQVIPLVKDRLVKLSDFSSLTSFFFVPAADISLDSTLFTTDAVSCLKSAIQLIKSVEFSLESLQTAFAVEIKKLGVKTGSYYMNLRIALAGSKFTPPITESMVILGQAETLARLERSYIILTTFHHAAT